jgi:stearoyl-CoA desaturase (delta-9 desaturase)
LVIGVAVYHGVALLAFVPWLFSWTGVVLCILGHYVFGVLGINLGYHRLLTHRGFRCPKWLEHLLVLLGACTLQQAPAYWVGVHRRHHQFADDAPDPHSPNAGFWWAHLGWVFVEQPGEERRVLAVRYAQDVLRDPFYAWLERYGWHLLAWLSWPLYFFGGYAAAMVAGETAAEALRFGASVLIWGVFVRTVLDWHLTWAVNSITHRWGYRSYETNDDSQNNLLIALITSGEGFHNNHHADPRSARHGHRWWELDVAYLIIRLLVAVGLATDVVMPARQGAKPR